MEENPYKAPAERGTSQQAGRKPIVTLGGCILAIITGFVVGFGLLYLIGIIRYLT